MQGAMGLNKALISSTDTESADDSSVLWSLDNLLLFFGLSVCFFVALDCRCAWCLMGVGSSAGFNFVQVAFDCIKWLRDFLIFEVAGDDVLLRWECREFCGEEGGTCLGQGSKPKNVREDYEEVWM